MSPRALLLNLSNESVDDALNLLKDSEEQEENQKREIKRLFTEALLKDKSGIQETHVLAEEEHGFKCGYEIASGHGVFSECEHG